MHNIYIFFLQEKTDTRKEVCEMLHLRDTFFGIHNVYLDSAKDSKKRKL